jgi:hypothetical protein
VSKKKNKNNQELSAFAKRQRVMKITAFVALGAMLATTAVTMGLGSIV